MLRKSVLAAVLAVALAAAGVAAAAAVTHPHSLRSLAASHSSKASGTKITLHKTNVGKVLATSSGMTLYLFKADHGKKSACYGKCATFWPPVMKNGKLSAAKGVKAKLLGTTKRKNGKLQVTYKGHPLYRFKLDKGSGQATGQGQNFFGGLWYVVSSGGSAITKAPPSTGTTTNSTTTTGTTTRYTTTYRY
jgi:predicted lipoprotein with Yx(FWY)xxD motif